MKYIIGITGGIATGKSTVSNYLINQQFKVVDCDKLTAQSYIDCFDEIKAFFPDCIVNGEISRPLLSKRVFSSEKDKSTLEKIIHPYVRNKMLQEIKKCEKGLMFLDIPLLYEAHMEDLCDEIWVVYIDEQLQLERLMKRNQMEKETAKLRIHSQLSIEEKKKKADVVINNQTTLQALYQQIEKRLGELDEYIN